MVLRFMFIFAGDDLILADTMDGETVVGSGRAGLLGTKDSLLVDTHFSPSNSSNTMGTPRRKTGGPIMSSVVRMLYSIYQAQRSRKECLNHVLITFRRNTFPNSKIIVPRFNVHFLNFKEKKCGVFAFFFL